MCVNVSAKQICWTINWSVILEILRSQAFGLEQPPHQDLVRSKSIASRKWNNNLVSVSTTKIAGKHDVFALLFLFWPKHHNESNSTAHQHNTKHSTDGMAVCQRGN